MSFKFLPHVILRSPRLSYTDYDPGRIGEMLADEDFRTAIFLSSKAFYNALLDKGFKLEFLNDREKITLQNYYNRISFRSTPFGAFSSFTCLHWSNDGSISLNNAKMHLLPDQQYLQLYMRQGGTMGRDIEYTVNPTIYKLGQNYRFIKTIVSTSGTAYKYSLQTFRATALLTKMIPYFNRTQVKISALKEYLTTRTGCTEEEAGGFVAFLDDTQILLKDNLPGVLGADSRTFWPVLDHAFISVDHKDIPTLKEAEELEGRLKVILPEEERHKVSDTCYVNLQRFSDQGLNVSFQKRLAEVIEVGKALMVPPSNSPLKTFAKEFERRFEKRAIPLLQALDPVTGIGYGESASDGAWSSLLERLDLRQDEPADPQITWTTVHNFFMKKMMASMGRAIEVTDSDIASLRSSKKIIYPASFSMLFNVADDTLIMNGTGGVSGNALIGRFTPFNPGLLQSAKEVAKLEAEYNPGIVFAEINHLSDSHIDNINRRCPVYQYEIQINTMPVERLEQIALSDLWVRIIDGEAVLGSASLKKRVIPRYTSAYNYRRNDLSLFRFLSDLQYQNICYDLDFSLEKLFPDLDFYPRVEYNGSILSLARWVLKKEQIKEISASEKSSNIIALREFLKRQNIPFDVSLGASDKQLYFDLEDNEQAMLFIENIKAEGRAVVTEFIRPKKTIANDNGKPLINQFVAFLVNTDVTYQSYQPYEDKPYEGPARDFSLGSEWLYLKVYCSPLIANELITEKIVPFMNKIIGKQADKWFFVRYYENGHHVRLRIHAINNNTGHILEQLHGALAGSIKFNLIREFKADTYRREIERYGKAYIEAIETVFYKSSIAVSAYIKIQSDAPEIYPYYAYAFLSVMRLLKIFMPDVQEQITYTHIAAANFITEFKDGKELKISLDKKYREVEKELETLTDKEILNFPSLKQKQIRLERAFKILLHQLKDEPLNCRKQLVADIIHMHLNRAFAERQRHHELVVYYCINKKLRSEFARTVKKA